MVEHTAGILHLYKDEYVINYVFIFIFLYQCKQIAFIHIHFIVFKIPLTQYIILYKTKINNLQYLYKDEYVINYVFIFIFLYQCKQIAFIHIHFIVFKIPLTQYIILYKTKINNLQYMICNIV